MSNPYIGKLVSISIFAAAMAFVESAVVIYLRGLFYPQGFQFPLEPIPHDYLQIEILREAATLIMLSSVAYIAGSKFWDKFGWFLIMFGVWDIFYYIWLRLTIDWPSGLLEPDLLFLIPVPWIGPVLLPVLVSIWMITAGLTITWIYKRGGVFHPGKTAWICVAAGTVMILYSYMENSFDRAFGMAPSVDYSWWMLFAGLALYGFGLYYAWESSLEFETAV